MVAARAAADETVSTLLSLGASPDKTLPSGTVTALTMAIQSKCLSTINLLAPVTNVSLGESLIKLAASKMEISHELEEMIERAAQDYESAFVGLQGAARYGSSRVLAKILHHVQCD